MGIKQPSLAIAFAEGMRRHVKLNTKCRLKPLVRAVLHVLSCKVQLQFQCTMHAVSCVLCLVKSLLLRYCCLQQRVG
jgi:hypothetical protein